MGLGWATFMYLFMEVLLPISRDENIDSKKALIGIPVWILGGVLWAVITRYFTLRKAKRNS